MTFLCLTFCLIYVVNSLCIFVIWWKHGAAWKMRYKCTSKIYITLNKFWMCCIENDNTSSPQILSHKKHIKPDWYQMDLFLCLIIFILLNLFRKYYSSFITYLVLLMCFVLCVCLHHVHVGPHRRQKQVLYALQLKWQAIETWYWCWEPN